MIRILESKDMGRLLARRAARLTEAEEIVRPILETVRKRGDKGLLELRAEIRQPRTQIGARASQGTRGRGRDA